MTYYLRFWIESLKLDIKSRMQYRADLLLASAVSLLSYSLNFLFFLLVFRQVHSVNGTDWGQMLVFIGTAQLVMSVYAFAGGRAQDKVFAHVLQGTWDRVKTRPANEIVAVLLGYPDSASFISVVYSAALVAAGFIKTGADPARLPVYFLALLAALLTYSAITALMCAMTFYFVSVPAFAAVISSLAGYAVLPRAVYKGLALVLFGFLFPVAVWGNMPAEVLLHGTFWWQGTIAATVFLAGSLAVLRYAASSYESAGG